MTDDVRPPAVPPPPPPAVERRRPTVEQAVTGLVLVAVGAAWLLAALDVAAFRLDVLLAVALLIVGGGLAVGARTGPHGGLISVGVALTLVLAVASSVGTLGEVPWTGGIGARTEAPAAIDDGAAFRLAVGRLEVDLRNGAVPAGGAAVEATVGMGRLVVRVPEGASVRVEARAGAGSARALDSQDSGFDVRVTAGAGTGPRLEVDAAVGIGEVVVER